MNSAIRARAETTPDELALADDAGSRTWAQVADDLERVAGALLAVAPGPTSGSSVLGDNAIATLETHAAALTVGVGTVATSRQLRANELVDQYRDASVVLRGYRRQWLPRRARRSRHGRHQDRRRARRRARRRCRRVGRLAGLGSARAARCRSARAEALAGVHLWDHRAAPAVPRSVGRWSCHVAPTSTSPRSPRSQRSRPVPISSSARCSTTRR